MRKSHLVLLVITAVTALFSAYSLAAMNQVYQIDYKWYSQYNKSFVNDVRDTSLDRWTIHTFPEGMRFDIIGSKGELGLLEKSFNTKGQAVSNTDFNNNILIHCTLGKVYLPEYRIKVIDIAQKGNVVEVRVSMNSPFKLEEENCSTQLQSHAYYPEDVIRIDLASFPAKGELVFIFKNQDGKQISEKRYVLKGDMIESTLHNLAS